MDSKIERLQPRKRDTMIAIVRWDP